MTRSAAARVQPAPATAEVVRLHDDAAGERAWAREVEGYMVYLESQRKSPATLRQYGASLDRWVRFCRETGRSLDPRATTRHDARAFLTDLQRTGRPGTTVTRFVSVSTFYKWLASEEEAVIEASPFAGIRRPKVPTVRVPVVGASDLAKLLGTVTGRSFEDRRDRAIILLMASTGCRRNEIASLLVEDLDLRSGRLTVHGKGDRVRDVAFGSVTQDALRVYLRAREDHRDADLEVTLGTHRDDQRTGRGLFLVTPGTGHRGILQDRGYSALLDRRATEAGIDHIHPHQLRHTWAHGVLSGGMSEGDAMRLGGWSTRDMLDRYAADTAADRAIANYRDPVDRMLVNGRGRRARAVGR